MSNLEKILAGLSPEQRRVFLLRLQERSQKADAGAPPKSEPAEAGIPRRAPDLDPVPLSFSQERFWFLEQLEPGNPAFNVAQAVRLRGEVSDGLFAAAFAEIVRR